MQHAPAELVVVEDPLPCLRRAQTNRYQSWLEAERDKLSRNNYQRFNLAYEGSIQHSLRIVFLKTHG
jgi:hypothetical protein